MLRPRKRSAHRPLRVAICGAGVAGPTAAYWLLRAGHTPTLIEDAPVLRAGGYMIDFWGVGYTIAERMGLLPALTPLSYAVRDVRFLDGSGHRVSSFSAETFRRVLGGRFISLPRGDLAQAIYRSIEGRVEAIFDDSLAACRQSDDSVEATLRSGARRTFDLVIGADGLHSSLRRHAFAPDDVRLTSLGYYAAAFEARGYRPRDELAYVSHAAAGRQISRFSLRGDRTMFLFVFAGERLEGPEPQDLVGRKQALASAFADVGWEAPAILSALQGADDVYFDRMTQVSMGRWTRGRVALVGDAASSVSLLAGEGAGLAMAQAYVLAGELAQSNGDHAQAFAAYERRLRRFVAHKQQSARRFAPAFCPRTSLGVWTRDRVARALRNPVLADLLLGADLRDRIALPDYNFTGSGGSPP